MELSNGKIEKDCSSHHPIRIQWMNHITGIDADDWNALAIPLKTPFLEWEWLHQLESSGSIAPENGWWPNHLTLWSHNKLVGAAPMYLKQHSIGEFVFDYAWVDLANRLGIAYFPKLIGMSPVTPVPGYRFLIDPDDDKTAITARMCQEIDAFCLKNRISGCSFLYVDPEWQFEMEPFGYTGWIHQSYSWLNREYKDFDSFLSIFNSKQRHNIKKEALALKKMGIVIRPFTGDDIPPNFIPLLYRYYSRTNDKFGPWGCKFLNPSFFQGIYESYRHRMLVMAAFNGQSTDTPIGMSFLLCKGDDLYGRYWGCHEDINTLHFNTCYYSPIAWAIDHGIRHYDPGIGSAHKIRRGFRAVPNYSLHRFYDPKLQTILTSYIGEINRLETEHINELNGLSPYAKRASHPST